MFEKDLYLSVISEMELLSYNGLTERDKDQILAFLKTFIIINIDENIKLNTIEVKKMSGLKLPDSIIAATAITLNLPFITSDNHFKKVKDLNLVYYNKPV